MKLLALSRGILILTVCLTLAACSNPQARYKRDFYNAKQSFAHQNYSSAFTQIRSPAIAGNPDAQYALGYMYYNGLGTIASSTKASYWFQKAAAQGNDPAHKALLEMKGASYN
jgi:TPR repeat protein